MATNYSLSDFISDPVTSDAVLSYSKSRVPTKSVHALKNGQIAWDAMLDLKGLKTEAAREALIQFISSQAQIYERCVLIIHGKDSRHGVPPLIKNLVNQWLPQLDEVLAFYSAQVKDGGLEAVYVLLKKASRTDLPTRLPTKGRESSFLVAETRSMERKRRLAEQQGERQLAPVKAREHSDEEPKAGPEGELQNSILQHPALDSQRFDGIDPNLNPEPPLNTKARREFDNEKREQEKEKQLRLGNMPRFTSTPTPRGP
ncbi:Smr/MutS family protein [Legionella fallonii]|uniref:Putative Smr domain protein n=1 Tax=Legionella fallonii LLAP-10 TaxID=1212491 RepID=A0A098G6R8_9GAMM|nr:Smr/MutS family protein [Legionella fallonii]CEG57679.1 putative Smr domain protein [Legionella fallonii LLAP-10]